MWRPAQPGPGKTIFSNWQTPDGFEPALLSDRLLYFGDVTAAVSSRGQKLTSAEIRGCDDLTEQSRPEWIDDGKTIRVVPLQIKRNPSGCGIAKDLGLSLVLPADRAEEREGERRRLRS